KEDSLIYNGADDNGSGTSSILEIAEAFMLAKKEGNGPRRSVLIMPVSGEEKGLLGSKYYADNPIYPLENTVANLNVDMIGRIDDFHDNPNYVYLIGSDRLSTELHNISESVNDKHFNLDLDYKFNDEDDPNRYYYRSDHYNFAKNNIPVIFYFNGVHADYHQTSDTIDKIIFPKIEKISRFIFLTAWELANRDERPKLDAN
ncbi:M28 family peptidase, partial [Flavobacteriales bacterium]|nr:M28 family peptidase [Flavobacteriales bacterium]